MKERMTKFQVTLNLRKFWIFEKKTADKIVEMWLQTLDKVKKCHRPHIYVCGSDGKN
jgi:hypothetical protein